jgi:hypothetical protein
MVVHPFRASLYTEFRRIWGTDLTFLLEAKREPWPLAFPFPEISDSRGAIMVYSAA